jgi:hypothetical protein
MPGQTEFALCLNGQIDGRKVAFTGDNVFGDPDDMFPIRIKADPNASAGVHLMALDVTLDGQRYGEWFDFIVNVQQ